MSRFVNLFVFLLAATLAACQSVTAPDAPRSAPAKPVAVRPSPPLEGPVTLDPAGLFFAGPDSTYAPSGVSIPAGETRFVGIFFRFDRAATITVQVFQPKEYCGTSTANVKRVRPVAPADDIGPIMATACNFSLIQIVLPPGGGRRDLEVEVKGALPGTIEYYTVFYVDGKLWHHGATHVHVTERRGT